MLLQDRMSFVLMDDVIHIGLFDGHAGHNTSSYLQVSQDMLQLLSHD